MNRRNFLANSAVPLLSGALPARRQASAPPGARGVKPLKITEVRIYAVSIAGRYPVVVQILTDQGVTGIGDAAVAYGNGALSAAAMAKELAEQYVLGKDPSRIQEMWSDMYDHTFWAKGGGTILYAAISAIEQALWDIKGKCLGVPIYELLGGKLRDSVRVYANGWSFRCTKPAEFAREAEQVVKQGYDALKLYPLATAELDAYGHIRHVSNRTITAAAEENAVATVRAVRAAIGPGIDLMLDVSAELTPDAIVRLARRFEESNITFIEEPVDPFDPQAMKKFSGSVNIPVATGERLYTRYGFRPIFELQAVAIVQPDVGNTGGIMETRMIAAMAEAYNMRVQPHNCSSPICTVASLQVDACIPNFYIQEVYPFRVPEHFAIVDRAPELEIRKSIMPIPTRPGLGVELVEERVRPFLWATCKL